MTTVPVQPKTNSILIPIFGIVAALLVAGVLTRHSFGISDRTAFFAVAALGFTMCALGKLGQGSVYGWWNLRHLTGYVLGIAGLYLLGAVLFHWQLPWISSQREAFLALSALILVKVGIAATYPRKSS